MSDQTNDRPFPSDPIKPAQAAKLLGIHPSQLYRWMAQGRLDWWELPGGHRRLSRAEVLALPKQGRPKPRRETEAEKNRLAELGRKAETERTLKEFGLGEFVGGEGGINGAR